MRAPELSHINLNSLVALDALLDVQNVRRAAERIGVTQSAMSHTLRQLRALLDDQILVRSGNRMLPTPRARALEVPLRQALLQLQHLVERESAFDAASTNRRFTIAGSDAALVTVLPRLLAGFATRAPHAQLDVVPLAAASIARELESGEVDVALSPIFPDAPGLKRRSLAPTEFAVLVRADHPEVGAELDLDTYCRLPHALVAVTGRGPGLVDQALARVQRSRWVMLRIPYFLAAPAILLNTDMLLTIPRAAAERFAAEFPLRVLPPPVTLPTGTLSVGWHERFDRDPAGRWLRELLVEASGVDPETQ